MTVTLPAWSGAFSEAERAGLARELPIGALARETVFGDADGAGVTIAVIDSGVDAGHPAIDGRVARHLRVADDAEGAHVVDDGAGGDVVGHGTACAGIVAGIAPGADIVAIRVLGADNRGKGLALAAAVDWAIEQRIAVVNLSLSSRSDALYGAFHDLADRAYFANTLLVCAANNIAGPSYPSLFAAVLSVAAHDVPDPEVWFYNPHPPVEFGAFGVDVDVAWRDGGRIRATGNSFAAPHLAGQAARLRSRHPAATPFEVKALLAATASRLA
jgi:subtilisin family serine protease